jgi:hypothetical protein
LRGIDYLHHVKKRCHGNLSVLLNVVIVNGRAKITGMENAVPKKNLGGCRDYSDLSSIVELCFETKQQTIPTELQLFLKYISKAKPSRYVNYMYVYILQNDKAYVMCHVSLTSNSRCPPHAFLVSPQN